MFRFDRIGVGLHRPGSAKSSASAQRFSSGLEPPELPCAVRRVLKKTIRQDLCFLSCSARRFSSGGDMRRPRSCPASGGGCWSPGDTCQPRSCSESGGGNQSHGDTRCPQSCPAWPRSCHKLGGGNQSRGDTWHPWSCPAPGHAAPPELPCAGRRVLAPELPQAGLLLVVSGDFFLVTSYCPTKNSRIPKNVAILLRSHRRHCSYALAVIMVSSSTSSGHVPVLRCLVLFNGTNYHDWVSHMRLHMRRLYL
jgi:hypothetical protein